MQLAAAIPNELERKAYFVKGVSICSQGLNISGVIDIGPVAASSSLTMVCGRHHKSIPTTSPMESS